MKSLSRVVGGWLVVLVGTGPLAAEVPPLKEKELRAEADLVITGVVKAIRTKDVSPEEGKVDRHFAFTVTILATEKGPGGGDAKSVVVRGWQAKKRPEGFAGPGGHYTVPGFRRLSDLKVKSEVRWFLKRQEDGTYDIVSPNGFEVLQKKGEPK